MANQTFASIVRWAASILLVFEGILYLLFSYSLIEFTEHAQNYSPSMPMPPAIWWNASIGILLVGLALLYSRHSSLRHGIMASALGIGFIIYGYWGFSAYRYVASFTSLSTGDVVAWGVVSGGGFIVIGILFLLNWFVHQQRQ
jgi:hypothetical protein